MSDMLAANFWGSNIGGLSGAAGYGVSRGIGGILNIGWADKAGVTGYPETPHTYNRMTVAKYIGVEDIGQIRLDLLPQFSPIIHTSTSLVVGQLQVTKVFDGRPSFSLNKSVDYLTRNAYPQYNKATCGNCAKAVRESIEIGGINTDKRPVSASAKDYGPYLKEWGFNEISLQDYEPVKGDVRVIQSYKGGSKHGHLDMFNGEEWVSDFKQNGFWPGSGYRKYKPSYSIFRW